MTSIVHSQADRFCSSRFSSLEGLRGPHSQIDPSLGAFRTPSVEIDPLLRDISYTDVSVVKRKRQKRIGQYLIGRVIGEGSFCKVRSAVDMNISRPAAAKSYSRSKLERIPAAEQSIRNEIAILKRISHPNVVKLYDVVDDTEDSKLYVFLELLDGGSLEELITEHLNGVPIVMASSIFRQIALGVRELHRNGIAHRDIKADNIVFDSDRVPKIIDFGLASCGFEECSEITIMGSPAFQPPEAVSSLDIDPLAADIWALGITLAHMLIGSLPFNIDEGSSSIFALYSQAPQCVTIPATLDASARELLAMMLENDPLKRATIDMVVEHDFCAAGEPGLVNRISTSLKRLVTGDPDELPVGVVECASPPQGSPRLPSERPAPPITGDEEKEDSDVAGPCVLV